MAASERRARLLACALALSAPVIACTPEPFGGVTARLEFPDPPEEAGRAKRALRLNVVPLAVARLQIFALEVDGSTLAETNLYAFPMTEDQLRLDPTGGTWRLEQIPIGSNRTVVGRAFLGPSTDPRIDNLLVFEGRVPNVEVRSGEIVDIGVIDLSLIEGVRYPPFDFAAPDAPNPAQALVVPEGEAIAVSFQRPQQPDVAGYMIAVGTEAITPELERGYIPQIGDPLGGDVVVRQLLASPSPEQVTIDGLIDNAPYRFYVFAYDADFDGRPLNFSEPAMAFGFPKDHAPPGAIVDLALASTATGSVEISFTAPGEDGNSGTPARYEIKVADSQLALETNFQNIPRAATPPPVLPPGERVRFTRTFAELGVRAGAPFFIGARAIDAAQNAGAVGIAEYVVNPDLPPAIAQLVPQIGIAGDFLTIEGANFGSVTGTVSLAFTTTAAQELRLSVNRWEDTSILAVIPANARSGVLTVSRGDAASARSFLSVVLRVDGAFDRYVYPFEVLATETGADTRTITALYRERDLGASYEGAIERAFDEVSENDPLAELVYAQRSTAIAGAYAAAQDYFLFIAANDPLSMHGAFTTSSTIANTEGTLDPAVAAGAADSVAIIVLDGGAGREVPVLIAFSREGVIRTATVADARVQQFTNFTAYTSTAAAFDRVTLARSTSGVVMMAHRAVTGGIGELYLAEYTTADPDGFDDLPAAMRPRIGEGLALLAVDLPAGGEEFVAVFEEEDLTGSTEIRLLRASDFGTARGYAPFAFDTLRSYRLEDAGVVLREGEPWIAVLASRIGVAAEARYTEVPLSALTLAEDRRGAYNGVVLDNATTDTRGRIGCKPGPMRTCPIVWLGENVNVMFLRR